MKEILKLDDPVDISWATSLLEDHGIKTFQVDTHTNSMRLFLHSPVRIMVIDEDYERAMEIMKQAYTEMDNTL